MVGIMTVTTLEAGLPPDPGKQGDSLWPSPAVDLTQSYGQVSVAVIILSYNHNCMVVLVNQLVS